MDILLLWYFGVKFSYVNVDLFMCCVSLTVLSDSEPCPSLVIQQHIADALKADEELATKFLDTLLNQLNWAFSEFIGMLQEVSMS